MTFATPINLNAGPSTTAFVWLVVIGLSTLATTFLAPMSYSLKGLALGVIVLACGCGLAVLKKHCGRQLWILPSGAMLASTDNTARMTVQPAGSAYSSRSQCRMRLADAGGFKRNYVVSAENNTADDYRRLRVWISHSGAFNLAGEKPGKT